MDPKTDRIIRKIAQMTRRSLDDVGQWRALRELVHDSFALVELVVELEEEFGVHFTQDDFAQVVTVSDLTQLIGARMPAETV
jgi:acyl carrier protein